MPKLEKIKEYVAAVLLAQRSESGKTSGKIWIDDIRLVTGVDCTSAYCGFCETPFKYLEPRLTVDFHTDVESDMAVSVCTDMVSCGARTRGKKLAHAKMLEAIESVVKLPDDDLLQFAQ
jgi:hypothetical protein